MLVVTSFWGQSQAQPILSDAPARSIDPLEAKHHVVYGDLDPARSFEVRLRLDALADAFEELIELEAWPEMQPLPVFLYGRAEDYRHALDEAHPHVFAVYNGKELRAALDEELFSWESIWWEVQHSALQQFSHWVLARNGQSVPTWLGAGLAEYFAQGLWCGEGMVLGLVTPARTYQRGQQSYTRPGRVSRVQQRIRAGQFQPLDQFFSLDAERWAQQNQAANYDQAWALVHFLLHGRSGQYRPALIAHLNDIRRGIAPGESFATRFGRDLGQLESAYRQWWLEQDESLGRDSRDRAMMATLVSILARSQSAGQRFGTAEAFFAAARAGELKITAEPAGKTSLPQSLVDRAVARADALPGRQWQLKQPPGVVAPQLVMTRGDGAVFTASAEPTSRPGRFAQPVVDVTQAPASQPAE